MQQTFKKVVATTLGLALILTMILFIMPVQTANADTVVWEKVDYKNYLKSDPLYTDGAGAYYGNVNEIPYFRQFNYLYILLLVGAVWAVHRQTEILDTEVALVLSVS